ncbi:hypothetical protein Slala03_24360 [Streptomyces lavendulae subsp. lavendulae]|nr:hypothetical protein Slala03_24360 [Streptomyces lavendulae subsp. lavendulae]
MVAGVPVGQARVKGDGSRSGWLSRRNDTSMVPPPSQAKVVKVSRPELRPPETKPLDPVISGIQIRPSGPGWGW